MERASRELFVHRGHGTPLTADEAQLMHADSTNIDQSHAATATQYTLNF